MDKIINFLGVFLVVWLIVIAANQILLYHSCFKLYCLKAAVPHTSIIAAIISGIYVFKK